MKKLNIIIITSCFQLISTTSVQNTVPRSPCPDIFRYETDGFEWYGVVRIKPIKGDTTANIKLRLNLPGKLPLMSPAATINLYENTELAKIQLKNGWPISYKIIFPIQSHLPTLSYIIFNDKQACINKNTVLTKGKPGKVFYFELKHKFDLIDEIKNSGRNLQKVDKKPTYDGRVIFEEPETSIVSRGGFPDLNYVTEYKFNDDINPVDIIENVEYYSCGRRAVATNPLIVGGVQTDRSDWPWLVAIFVRRPRGLDFVCAGTLISTKMIVTASHCVLKSGQRLIPSKFIIKLGAYSLHNWLDKDTVTRRINRIETPVPISQQSTISHDIAVLVMSEDIAFTNYIRPACLWDNASVDITGKIGIVAGWGRDETGISTTAEPRMKEVLVVSTDVCRASRFEFFPLTSSRTICAGARDGTGPCNGDSGGGLYFLEEERWTLRGIISNSLTDPTTNSCNLQEYIIYTDVAAYVDWIKSL